ncbi:hypothetical protein NL676_012027 [Syzygium grande]|nr:hypothetical protein NL676_012027 [Syzygium grande]
MASERIGILKDGNDDREDLPRASKREGNSKAPREDFQKDPPTSSSAETTPKQDSCSHPSSSLGVCDVPEQLLPEIRETTPKQDSCSHPSSSLGACNVCGELLPEICRVPFEITQRWLGRISTEDVLWVWPGWVWP